jgi:phage tail sheath protein FI
MKFLESFVFEFNDEFTRSTITFNLNTFLEDIKNKRGLYDYKVVCDSSNNTPDVIDRDELMVDIYLQPVRVIEKILLRVVITRTGASFSEITL